MYTKTKTNILARRVTLRLRSSGAAGDPGWLPDLMPRCPGSRRGPVLCSPIHCPGNLCPSDLGPYFFWGAPQAPMSHQSLPPGLSPAFCPQLLPGQGQ